MDHLLSIEQTGSENDSPRYHVRNPPKPASSTSYSQPQRQEYQLVTKGASKGSELWRLILRSGKSRF
ncbi:unnamed protein product [Arabidopsis halleri]